MGDNVQPGSTMYGPSEPSLTGIEKMQKERLEEDKENRMDNPNPQPTPAPGTPAPGTETTTTTTTNPTPTPTADPQTPPAK